MSFDEVLREDDETLLRRCSDQEPMSLSPGKNYYMLELFASMTGTLPL